jgi:hypothetical protein
MLKKNRPLKKKLVLTLERKKPRKVEYLPLTLEQKNSPTIYKASMI